LPDILKQMNWVDVVFILLFVGMVYRGMMTGVGAQLLSFAGWIAVLYLSVRYFVFVSEAIFGFMLQGWAKPLSFLSIGIAGFVVLKFIERVFSVVLGSELSVLEKIGGAVVASLRAFTLFGMIGLFLLMTPVDYLWSSASETSKTCAHFVRFDAVVYRLIDGFFVSGETRASDNGVFNELLNKKQNYEKRKGER
jgi:uncharacterized membrane protein required for colicin V production